MGDIHNYVYTVYSVENNVYVHYVILNQARAGRRPARTWFLRIVLSVSVYVCVFVCSPPRLLITSGVMWCDIDPIRLIK